jgi:hypothetical protein
MTPSPQPTAGIKLLEGRSGRSTWLFEGRGGVSIGSGPTCRWRVEARGVAALHVLIYYDGECLWISDLVRDGKVLLDGQPVGIWQRSPESATLSVGGARFALRWRPQPGMKQPRNTPPSLPLPPMPMPPMPLPPAISEPEPPRPGRSTRQLGGGPEALETLCAPAAAVLEEPGPDAFAPVAAAPPPPKPASKLGMNILGRVAIVAVAFVLTLGVYAVRRFTQTPPAPAPYVVVRAVAGTAPAPSLAVSPVGEGDAMVSAGAAVDFLIAGRTSQAAGAYAALAAREPQEMAYGAIARILAARERADCPEGSPSCAP